MKLSIIIPAYNEQDTIGLLLEKVIKQSKFLDVEIIVVNDGSTDATVQSIQPYAGAITFIDLKQNFGKGKAIREGFKKAKGDIVIIQDADLELDPSDYPELIRPFIEKNADVVYGSRILGRRQHGGVFFWGGKLMTLVANVLYGISITDQTNGYKVLRREVFESLHLTSDGFEICSEMTAKIAKKGLKIHEVPVSYFPRSKEEGKKLKIRHGIQAAWVLLKYKFIA